MITQTPDKLSMYSSFPINPPPPPASSPASICSRSEAKPVVEYLPIGYEPGSWDVICQRGKDCHEHVGNRRFRVCVENHVDSYINAKTRQEKSSVISKIVKSIKQSTSETYGFVMKDPGTQRWHLVDNKVARDKVGNALRDAARQHKDGTLGVLPSTRGVTWKKNTDLQIMKKDHARDSGNSWMNSQFDVSMTGVAPSPSASNMMHVTPDMTLSESQEPAAGEYFKHFSSLVDEDQPGSSLMNEVSSPFMKMSLSSKLLAAQRLMDQCLQPLDGECFSLEQNSRQFQSMHTSTRACLEALADSLEAQDMDTDLEPRPIELLRNQ